jgi:hypothetical protein
MTAPDPSQIPTTPPGSSPTPPSGQAGAPTEASPAPDQWKAGPSAGAFAGKTAEEILGLTSQLAQTVQQQQQWIQQMQYQQQQPAPTPTPSPSFGDDDFITGRQAREWADTIRAQQAPVQSHLQAQMAQGASLTLGVAEQKWAKEFQRWGGEIKGEWHKLPPNMQTLDSIALLVDIARGRHVEELAQERAQALAANYQDPTMRSLGGAGSGSAPSHNPTQGVLDNPAIPEAYRIKLKEQGLTDSQIREFCEAQGINGPGDFVKLFGTNVVAGG